MHELAIAVSLVELACEEAARLADARVQALHVEVGVLSGVVKEALAFSFEVAAAGTIIEGARLVLHDRLATIWCATCRAERSLRNICARYCPVCQVPTPDLLTGDELRLLSLEVR